MRMRRAQFWLFVFNFMLLLNQPVLRADSQFSIKPTGFLKFGAVAASRAVDSFGNTNMSAPTVASSSNALGSNLARGTFQIAQSRFGAWIDQGKVKGHLEFDLIDFAKASPVTQIFPRLRIADLDYQIDDSQTVSFGQDWDLFASPYRPFTYNFVGFFFQSGNVGFMRNQVTYSLQASQGLQLVELPRKNGQSAKRLVTPRTG